MLGLRTNSLSLVGQFNTNCNNTNSTYIIQDYQKPKVIIARSNGVKLDSRQPKMKGKSIPASTIIHCSNSFTGKSSTQSSVVEPIKQILETVEHKELQNRPFPYRQLWPIIPYADNNFTFALGLEGVHLTNEVDELAEMQKKNRPLCVSCGHDFGSGWHYVQDRGFYCNPCHLSILIKEHRTNTMCHLANLNKEVEQDEKDFDRYSELFLKQHQRLQIQQQQQQQQQSFKFLQKNPDSQSYHTIPALLTPIELNQPFSNPPNAR